MGRRPFVMFALNPPSLVRLTCLDPAFSSHFFIEPLLEDPIIPMSGAGPAQDTPLLRYFNSAPDIFGLSKSFCLPQPPTSVSEESVPSPSGGDAATAPLGSQSGTSSTFYPYPNLSSFLLGDWYWNGGVQKSQQNFKALLGIIGHTDFSPHDIKGTDWGKINGLLAESLANTSGGGQDPNAEWLSEGWKNQAISINVPFHKSRTTWMVPPSKLIHSENSTIAHWFRSSRSGSQPSTPRPHFTPPVMSYSGCRT